MLAALLYFDCIGFLVEMYGSHWCSLEAQITEQSQTGDNGRAKHRKRKKKAEFYMTYLTIMHSFSYTPIQYQNQKHNGCSLQFFFS